jgi:hypothetical protein
MLGLASQDNMSDPFGNDSCVWVFFLIVNGSVVRLILKK